MGWVAASSVGISEVYGCAEESGRPVGSIPHPAARWCCASRMGHPRFVAREQKQVLRCTQNHNFRGTTVGGAGERRFALGANNPPFAMRPRRMGHPVCGTGEATG